MYFLSLYSFYTWLVKCKPTGWCSTLWMCPQRSSQSLTCNINRAWLMEQFLWQCGLAESIEVRSYCSHGVPAGNLRAKTKRFDLSLVTNIYTPVADRSIISAIIWLFLFSVWPLCITGVEKWRTADTENNDGNEDHEISWADYLGWLTASF